MVKLWLILGLFGWFALMIYRFATDGLPKGVSFMSYVRGFVGALILGPLCFGYLVYLLLGSKHD